LIAPDDPLDDVDALVDALVDIEAVVTASDAVVELPLLLDVVDPPLLDAVLL